MSRPWMRCAMLGWAAAGIVASGTAGAVAPMALPLHELPQLNPRLINAAEPPGRARLEALAPHDFLYTTADGDWLDRAAFLRWAVRRRPDAAAATTAREVRLYGPLALVQAVTQGADAAEPQARVRHTDLYRWQDGRWQLLHAHDTRLRDGVALAAQTAAAPRAEGWTGKSPAGSADEVLHALNDHYVRAFRESDVAWYDAHVTLDYRVISSDGSLQDRSAALARFALPTFATQMADFPVGRVHIRRYGELALIHAENAYTLKDGRRGISRYTDIWRLHDGQWRCIGAQITVHRAPGQA